MTEHYFGFPAVVVEPGVRTGIAVVTENPREVGSDRIANAVGATVLYPGEPVIVVDFGTAITPPRARSSSRPHSSAEWSSWLLQRR